jgi:hypothetical protein
MPQVPVDAMKNRLSSYRRWNDHPPLMAIFPFTDSDLVKIEYEFTAGIMNMVFKAIDSRFEKKFLAQKASDSLVEHFCFQRVGPRDA